MSFEETIEVSEITYIVRELDTFDDQITLMDEGSKMRTILRLAVRRQDNEPINWKNVSKADGKKIWNRVDELLLKDKKDFQETVQTGKEKDKR